jgi:hypothetical protein
VFGRRQLIRASFLQRESKFWDREVSGIVDNADETCTGADALLVLTEWAGFYDLDLSRIKKLLRLPTVLDGENVVNLLSAQVAGLDYYRIGSTPVAPRKPFVLEPIHSH